MMSSFLRLSSLDRPSLGLSKRFSLLSNNTASSANDADRTSTFTSLHTLPSVERLGGDDFANMFDISDDEYVRPATSPRLPPSNTYLSLHELSATPSIQSFPELHGTPIVRSELPAVSTPTLRKRPGKVVQRSRPDSGQVAYRSSVSSSIPSTKRSNASSRISRKSSVSSMTEESSSERSSKDSDKENALHERLMKRRTPEKRVSFSGRTTQLRFRASSETNLLDAYNVQQPQLQTISPSSSGPNATDVRPASRGMRLGQAMADGLATSPPPTPRTVQKRTSQSGDTIPSDIPATRTGSRDSSNSVNSCRRFPVSAIESMDRVRVGIMSHMDNIADLQSCAQISRDFYTAFQKYETILVDCVLYKQSRAAWELRHSVRHLEKPSPFRLRSVQKDFATISALEDFLVWRCQSALRPQSLKALLGEAPRRKAELEDAIWMTWTFCNVFGKTSTSSDASLAKQTQWLNAGHARTRKIAAEEMAGIRPCNMRELEDMSEIWRCLEILLSGFKGRESEARQAGLFANVGTTKLSDRDLLSAWVHDILSLGPKAVLTLSSCDFEQAKVLGITKWTPPAKSKGRSNFLKAAVEEVYRDRLMKEARQKALDYRNSAQYNHKRSISDPAFRDAQVTSRAQPPMSTANRHLLKVDTRHPSNPTMQNGKSAGFRGRNEIRPDCDPLSATSNNFGPVLSPSTNPMVFSPLSMTQNASTRLGATLFPMQNRDQSQRYSIPMDSMLPDSTEIKQPPAADVIDPADKALALLVQEMGFSESEAKRALAQSDTGAGINIEIAVEMLSAGQVGKVARRPNRLSELPAAVGNAQLARKRSKREVCEGHCKPMLLVEPKRERVSGLGMVKRNLSYRMSFRKSNRLSVIVDEDDSNAYSSSQSGSRTSTLRSVPSTKRGSALTDLASNSISAFTLPALANFEQHHAGMSPERSPVSPITPTVPEWLKPDTNPMANPQARIDTDSGMMLPTKPRITLQKVGTGMKKQGWTIPGRKKRDEIIRPEIIGYAY